jgi:hypothetical protein
MARRPIVRFLAVGRRLFGQPHVEPKQVAICLASSDVAAGETAGPGEALRPGEYLLVPEDNVVLSLGFRNLRGASEESFNVTAETEAEFSRTPLDGRLFRSEILHDRQEASKESIERLLSAYAREAVEEVFRAMSLEDVAAEGEAAGDALRAVLRDYLGRCGVALVEVRALRYGGEALARLREDRETIEAKRRKEAAEAAARFEAEARRSTRQREAEAAARTARLEQELRELKRLDSALEETGLETQILRLRDESVKARLYELLLERELSPEQIQARTPGRTPEDVEEELTALRGTVRRLLAERKRVEVIAAWQDYVTVWDVRPGTAPFERARWSPGFGPARTAVAVTFEGRRAVACGTPRGVVVIDGESGAVLRTFALPEEAAHGVNGIAVAGDALWATHWEAGVVRWPCAGGEGERITTRPARGIAFFADGTAVAGVAGGALLVRVAGEELVPFAGEPTAVVKAGSGVVVGTAGGTMYYLAPGRAPESLAGGREAVVSLAVVEREGRPYVLSCRKEQRIACAALDGGEGPAFVAPKPLRWIAASENAVAGSAKEGRVFVWAWERPETAAAEVSVPGDVRAVAVWEESDA